MKVLKSKSEVFTTQAIELTNIFYAYKKFTPRMKNSMEKLGYDIHVAGKHVKCYYENQFVTTISSSPSDTNAGDNVIRCIRLFWEQKQLFN